MKKKILLIVISIIVIIVIVVFGIIKITFSNSLKFVCKSSEGSITIYYKNDKINGYTKSGRFSYDLDEQKKLAEKIGMEEYLESFEEWFSSNFQNGKCEKK